METGAEEETGGVRGTESELNGGENGRKEPAEWGVGRGSWLGGRNGDQFV